MSSAPTSSGNASPACRTGSTRIPFTPPPISGIIPPIAESAHPGGAGDPSRWGQRHRGSLDAIHHDLSRDSASQYGWRSGARGSLYPEPVS